jgi:hypothetical protein
MNNPQMMFTIPFELTDLNTYINASRTNKFKSAKIKDDEGQKVALFCKNLRLPEDTQFDVECHWQTKDKRKDSDNVNFGVKFILDGVVAAGRLKDDSFKYIRNIAHFRTIGKTDCVTVIFKQVS